MPDDIVSGNDHNFEYLFPNPIREIFWYGRRKETIQSSYKLLDGSIDFNNYFNYLSHPSKTSQTNMFFEFTILVGSDTFITGTPQFFNYVIPNKYYKRTPRTGIFVYNFCEKPTLYQPSGIFNLPILRKVNNKFKFVSKQSNKCRFISLVVLIPLSF